MGDSQGLRGRPEGGVGLILVALSQVFCALMNVGVKLLTALPDPPPALEILFFRMAGFMKILTYTWCLTYMRFKEIPDPLLGPSGLRAAFVLRGVSGFFGIFGIYYSLQFLSLSDAVAITFLSPTCIAISGWLFLKEQSTLKELGAGFVSMSGVVLIARPETIFGTTSSNPSVEKGTPTQRLIAVGIALIGVIGNTVSIVTIRFIGDRAHPMHLVAFFAAWCLALSGVGTVTMDIKWILPADPKSMIGIVFVAFCGFAFQILLTAGLHHDTAGRASIALYFQVVFSLIFELTIFHNSPHFLGILGTAMIIAGAMYVAASKKPHESIMPDDDTSISLLPLE
ncbi:drug/metabolite transporter [Cantharellus anzutake]|uniref:drug/metabolite transporter n=1 Tax=Cantharellus anzutake TaxID=1750568 RepID=UPI0019043FDE|nr:drug/metabolite transporter [Cantharellus anzutake]KAF8327215.1 drug/metabolite transporter [Cantharellus anzutake]